MDHVPTYLEWRRRAREKPPSWPANPTVDDMVRWLYAHDQRLVEWGQDDARRLLFALWLLEHGRIR